MSDYSQPDFYRFNEDSIKLVKFVCSRIPGATTILDLGAGCGVIGIELARVLSPSILTLVDAQKDYKAYAEENAARFLAPFTTKVDFHWSLFGDFSPQRRFDLIVSNPPYFLPSHGESCIDRRRGIARSFQLENWSILIKTIEKSLSNEGKAFLVIKNDKRILREIIRTDILHMDINEQGQLTFIELSRLHKD